ncbi:reverse transcriptase domain-containing protein [Tanacetum coccineum]
MVSNQIRPPGFPPIQNNQNCFNQNQGNNFNQNRGTNFNQNRGNNFNQGQVYQPPTIQTPVYQAPVPQMQGVSKTDFENYVKANDVVLRNMQNQGQGTLPSQTTPHFPTPVIPTPLKEPERNQETLMDKVQKPGSESTAQVPPPEDRDSIFIEIPKQRLRKLFQEPNTSKANSYQLILPYPEDESDERKIQLSSKSGLELFKQLRLEIGLKDALIEIPKFNKWLCTLLRNKEKLEEIAITTVNVECSTIILNKVLEKLEDPGKFLIPCALQELNRTNALADFGASINLLPHSIYKQLGLGALKPTRMTLELANRSVFHPMAYAKDVYRRPFLRTAKALIDLYEEKLTLKVGNDELVFYAEKSEKNKNKQFAHAISIIDFLKDEPFSGSTTIHFDALPPSSSPVKTSDNLEEFADELTFLNSFPPDNDDSILKKDVHEENFQVYSNPLFEFDDNFNSSNENPLFDEMVEDVVNENSNVSNSDEPVLLNTPLSDKVECSDPEVDIDEIDAFLAMEVSSNFEEGYYDSEGDVIFLESLSDPLHHEFAREIITLPSRIAREHEEYLSLMTLLCEISTSQSPESFHANPSSIITSPIPVQEEIDIFLVPGDLIPPGDENDDSEDEDNSTFLPEHESPNLDHQDNPSVPRPPSEPPDVKIHLEPDTAVINNFDMLNKEACYNLEEGVQIFLPFFTYPEDSPFILSFGSEDLIFDPGIFIFHFSYLEPVVFSMEVSYSKYCSP